VASERQIAANRRNAQRSTGPRSKVGKKRASGNAHRHGLRASRQMDGALAQQLEQLARELAAGSANIFVRGWAESAAEALIHLARIRQVKLALFERLDSRLSALTTISDAEPPSDAPPADDLLNLGLLELLLNEIRIVASYERRLSSRRDKALAAVLQTGRAQGPFQGSDAFAANAQSVDCGGHTSCERSEQGSTAR
jgi:hypothetical protein